jgi:hypothetical protein
LKEQYLEGKKGCGKTSTTPEIQQLTVVQQSKELLATISDGKLPTNRNIDG